VQVPPSVPATGTPSKRLFDVAVYESVEGGPLPPHTFVVVMDEPETAYVLQPLSVCPPAMAAASMLPPPDVVLITDDSWSGTGSSAGQFPYSVCAVTL